MTPLEATRLIKRRPLEFWGPKSFFVSPEHVVTSLIYFIRVSARLLIFKLLRLFPLAAGLHWKVFNIAACKMPDLISA